MNKDAVVSYLFFRMHPAQEGIFGVRDFKPFQEPDYNHVSRYDEKYYLELLKACVGRVLTRDLEKVSVPLSGGLDSSSIVWAIREVAPDVDIHTYSVSFPNTGEKDEAEYAKIVAELFETKHRTLFMPNVMHEHEELVRTTKEPKWTLYTKKTYDMADTDVIISGMGGDELFAGYAWKYEVTKRWCPRSFWERATMWFAANDYGAPFEILGLNLWKHQDVMKHFIRFFGDETVDFLQQFRWSDLMYKAVWDFCYTEHRVCEEYGYDIRYPFLDQEMIKYGMGLPTSLLFREGLGKTIMRNAMIGKLPEEIILREKVGFGPNLVDVWENELLPACWSMDLDGGIAVDMLYINPEYVHSIMALDRISRDYIHHYKAMAQILSLEYLMRNYPEEEW